MAKAGAGVWTDRDGNAVDVAAYKVVPGDKLTYTQHLAVTLTGDKMAANILATGTGADNGFTPANVIVSDTVLTAGEEAVANPLTSSTQVTATITFEFKSGTTGRSDVSATYNFGNVSFTLQQIARSGLN